MWWRVIIFLTGISLIFTEGMSVVCLGFLNIHIICAGVNRMHNFTKSDMEELCWLIMRWLCVWSALTDILFIYESMAVQFSLDILYGINHGFDITHDLLVMAWHFNDILRFVFIFYSYM